MRRARARAFSLSTFDGPSLARFDNSPFRRKVYGLDWEVDEAAYALYDKWDASDKQRLDMVLFDGVKGLSRCCEG